MRKKIVSRKAICYYCKRSYWKGCVQNTIMPTCDSCKVWNDEQAKIETDEIIENERAKMDMLEDMLENQESNRKSTYVAFLVLRDDLEASGNKRVEALRFYIEENSISIVSNPDICLTISELQELSSVYEKVVEAHDLLYDIYNPAIKAVINE